MTENTKKWATVRKHPNYEVSNDGLVRNKKTGRYIALVESQGYHKVSLYGRKDGRTSTYKVHRLVSAAFISNPTGYHVDHINRVRSDNRVENLRLVDCIQNNKNRKVQENVHFFKLIKKIINLHTSGLDAETIYKELRPFKIKN